MREYDRKNHCRLCSSSSLESVLKLGDTPLCDGYTKEKKTQRYYNLELYFCHDCGFVQIDIVLNPKTVYREYTYIHTDSNHDKKYFKGTVSLFGYPSYLKTSVDNIINYLNIGNSKLVVDIGSNNGSFLFYFKQRGYKVLGIEPSLDASNIANKNGIETISNFFHQGLVKDILKNRSSADLITINNLYANIDNLVEFTEAVELLLSDNGVLIIESSYLVDMIENMVFDLIYHEHLSYFTILPLVKYFGRFNMKLIHVEHIDTKGGSLRYYWAKNSSKYSINSSVNKFIEKEKDYNIGVDVFNQFKLEIDERKNILIKFLEKNRDKDIIGFGASATSTTLISYYGLAKYLTYLVDENEIKVGTYSPGYHIPVNSVEKLLEGNISKKIVIILAWRFSDSIIEKNRQYLKNGGIFIIPLPNFQIIGEYNG